MPNQIVFLDATMPGLKMQRDICSSEELRDSAVTR